MKTKINSQMFFNILDAFDFMIEAYEKRKRKSVGLATTTDNVKERARHLAEARQYGDWAIEAYDQKRTFTDAFEADI